MPMVFVYHRPDVAGTILDSLAAELKHIVGQTFDAPAAGIQLHFLEMKERTECNYPIMILVQVRETPERQNLDERTEKLGTAIKSLIGPGFGLLPELVKTCWFSG